MCGQDGDPSPFTRREGCAFLYRVPVRPVPEPQCLTVGAVPVILKRSARRRTLGLQVRGGVASAHAPMRMPLDTILAFLESKRGWLEKHVARQQVQWPVVRSWQDGDELPFLGERLTLHLRTNLNRPARHGQELHVPMQDTTRHLQQWTRQAALGPYTALVRDYAARLGAEERLGRVAVSDTRTRWGSCTAQGNIRLHWALSRAPLEVLHYVALHEAAHLLELNHSARYWAHVARLMPGYAGHQRWLRENGHRLLED